MQGTGWVENQRIHRRLEISAEGHGQFPVPRHAAPQRIDSDQLLIVLEVEYFGKTPGTKRTQRECLIGATVEGCGGVQDSAVHHALARAADHHSKLPTGLVNPVPQLTGQAAVRGDQVRQLVDHEWTGPAGVWSASEERRAKNARQFGYSTSAKSGNRSATADPR